MKVSDGKEKPKVSQGRARLPDLRGKRALVTGASSGIGEATVKLFAQAGADVILVSDHASNLTRVLDALLASGARAMAAITDLTRSEQVDGLLVRLEEQVGPIDILVNNAGVGLGGTVRDTREADLRFVFEVNFFALHLLCQQALRLMIPRRHGIIINVTSAAGRFGSPTVSAYSASKGAVHAYTQALRIEAMSCGVQVCECLPISVKTRFFDNVRGEKYQPGGVVITPERVALSIVRATAARRMPAEIYPFQPYAPCFCSIRCSLACSRGLPNATTDAKTPRTIRVVDTAGGLWYNFCVQASSNERTIFSGGDNQPIHV